MSKNTTVEKTIKKEAKPVSLMITKADKLIIIKKDGDVIKATEFLIQVKNKIDELEDERKSYTQPINQSLRKLNSRFKELTEPLRKAEKIVKEAVLEYSEKREKERIEEEKKIQKETGNKNIKVVDSLPEIIESKSGESRTTKRWTFEVINEKKIPREYLMTDEKKVNSAIKNGVRKIAGLKIYQKKTLSIYR